MEPDKAFFFSRGVFACNTKNRNYNCPATYKIQLPSQRASHHELLTRTPSLVLINARPSRAWLIRRKLQCCEDSNSIKENVDVASAVERTSVEEEATELNWKRKAWSP